MIGKQRLEHVILPKFYTTSQDFLKEMHITLEQMQNHFAIPVYILNELFVQTLPGKKSLVHYLLAALIVGENFVSYPEWRIIFEYSDFKNTTTTLFDTATKIHKRLKDRIDPIELHISTHHQRGIYFGELKDSRKSAYINLNEDEESTLLTNLEIRHNPFTNVIIVRNNELKEEVLYPPPAIYEKFIKVVKHDTNKPRIGRISGELGSLRRYLLNHKLSLSNNNKESNFILSTNYNS